MTKSTFQRLKMCLMVSIIGVSLPSSAYASSFGLQAGIITENFPAGVQLELDTTDHSSIELGASALLIFGAGYKYFWNTTDHSGLFSEATVSTHFLAPAFAGTFQQGYRWMLDATTEFEIKGGMSIVGIENTTTNTTYPSTSQTSWSVLPIPAFGIRIGFRF
jgi:hypothetical protein